MTIKPGPAAETFENKKLTLEDRVVKFLVRRMVELWICIGIIAFIVVKFN
jgi:hypothetical protein